MIRPLAGALARLVALSVPVAVRQRLLRHAGDVALRAELLDVVRETDAVRKVAAEQRARAVRAEEVQRDTMGALASYKANAEAWHAQADEACAIATARGLREARALIWAERWKALAKSKRYDLDELIECSDNDVARLTQERDAARGEAERLSAELRSIDGDGKQRAAVACPCGCEPCHAGRHAGCETRLFCPLAP